MRTAALVLAALTLLVAPRAAPAQTPPEQLQEAARAYQRSDFKRVIALARPLLYPKILLSRRREVVQAHKLLAMSHFFDGDKAEAEKEFLALLSIDPTFNLDPLVDPTSVVNFLEDIKRKNADAMRKFLARERRDAERRRLAEEKRKAELQRLRKLAESAQEVVERSVERHPYWINFVPFGAGQFQNGHRTKGWILMGSQLTFGTLSLATALGLYFKYPAGSVPKKEWEVANAINYVAVAAGALFLASVAYGVVDAVIYWKPESVHEKTHKRNLALTPWLAPEGGGLGVGLAF